MLNLNDLRYFVQVAEQGGFAAAGRAMGLPKSTVSKRVAVLENELGARLLQRNARHTVLTPLGETILEHARTMLLAAEAVEAVAAERASEPRGLVRLTCSTITSQYYLAPLWPSFAAALPLVQVAVHVTDRMVDIVAEGYDLAIRDHIGVLPDSDLVGMRLGREPDYLVAAPDWVARNGAPTTPEQLRGFDGLSCAGQGRGEIWDLTHADGRQASVTPNVRFGSDDPSSVIAMAMAGMGIARLPRCICGSLIADEKLVRVLPEWQAGGPVTSLLYPSRRGQLPAVRAIIDLLARELPRGLDP